MMRQLKIAAGGSGPGFVHLQTGLSLVCEIFHLRVYVVLCAMIAVTLWVKR